MSYEDRIQSVLGNGPYTVQRLKELNPKLYFGNTKFATMICNILLYYQGDLSKYKQYVDAKIPPEIYKKMTLELLDIAYNYELNLEKHSKAVIDLTLVRLGETLQLPSETSKLWLTLIHSLMVVAFCSI